MLRRGPLPAGAIAGAFDISRPAVSRHLRVLRETGLVVDQPQGRERHYRLDVAPLAELDAWLAPFRHGWDAALDALATEVYRTRRERRERRTPPPAVARRSWSTNRSKPPPECRTRREPHEPEAHRPPAPHRRGPRPRAHAVVPRARSRTSGPASPSRSAPPGGSPAGPVSLGPGNTIRATLQFEEGKPETDMTIDACEPPRHVAVSSHDVYGTWRLEATLAERDGVTELTFVQHLDDGVGLGEVGPGWEYYLDRLVFSREESTSEPSFDDYYPSQKAYYEQLTPTTSSQPATAVSAPDRGSPPPHDAAGRSCSTRRRRPPTTPCRCRSASPACRRSRTPCTPTA